MLRRIQSLLERAVWLDCSLCNNAVNLALDWDPKGKLRIAAFQSKVGRALLEANGRKADDISLLFW
jgi:predicted DCC family thiol-disulfide oxidoreductase YuxK